MSVGSFAPSSISDQKRKKAIIRGWMPTENALYNAGSEAKSNSSFLKLYLQYMTRNLNQLSTNSIFAGRVLLTLVSIKLKYSV